MGSAGSGAVLGARGAVGEAVTQGRSMGLRLGAARPGAGVQHAAALGAQHGAAQGCCLEL